MRPARTRSVRPWGRVVPRRGRCRSVESQRWAGPFRAFRVHRSTHIPPPLKVVPFPALPACSGCQACTAASPHAGDGVPARANDYLGGSRRVSTRPRSHSTATGRLQTPAYRVRLDDHPCSSGLRRRRETSGGNVNRVQAIRSRCPRGEATDQSDGFGGGGLPARGSPTCWRTDFLRSRVDPLARSGHAYVADPRRWKTNNKLGSLALVAVEMGPAFRTLTEDSFRQHVVLARTLGIGPPKSEVDCLATEVAIPFPPVAGQRGGQVRCLLHTKRKPNGSDV